MRDTVEIVIENSIPKVRINGARVGRVYSINGDNGDIEIIIHKPRVVMNGKECVFEDGEWAIGGTGVNPIG